MAETSSTTEKAAPEDPPRRSRGARHKQEGQGGHQQEEGQGGAGHQQGHGGRPNKKEGRADRGVGKKRKRPGEGSRWREKSGW